MPMGLHTVSHRYPASQTGDMGKCNLGGGTLSESAMVCTNSFKVKQSSSEMIYV